MGRVPKEGSLINKQGLTLRTMYWAAEESSKSSSSSSSNTKKDPRRILVLVHGHGAHLEFGASHVSDGRRAPSQTPHSYHSTTHRAPATAHPLVELLHIPSPGAQPMYENSWAAYFNQQGIDVCGIDNQGCGRSDALYNIRWYVDKFDDYVDDVLQYTRHVIDTLPATERASAKVYIAGLSLGGCIALNCVMRDPALFKRGGLILMAPMISLEKISRRSPNKYMLPIARLLSYLVPTAPLVATEKNEVHPEIQEIWDRDPRTSQDAYTRVRSAYEYITACDRLMAALRAGGVLEGQRVLLFHSERDTMVDPEGSKALVALSASEDMTVRWVNDMWHVLTKEPGCDRVAREIASWMLAR